MRASAFALAFLVTAYAPLAAHAATRGGDTRGGAKTTRAQGGFNLNRDIAAPAQRRAQPVAVYRPQVTTPHARRDGGAHRNGPPITNPAHRGQRPWTWNHGVAWEAAPTYWGGGFWGPFALGAASYIVAPDSPGATLLANYQLTQTPCGPPDLVVIFGPDGGTICAYPNTLVAPGDYTIDWSTLTLIS